MNTLDDAALISKFVKQEISLASNQGLRIESAFDSVQLMAKRGGVVASIKLVENVPVAMVRSGTNYASLIHCILLENNFLPISDLNNALQQYRKTDIPAGYKLNCTEARALWKEWWTHMRYANRNTIQMELLIAVRSTWYPIREIVCSQGNLFIKTLGNELIFDGGAQICWLNRLATASEQSPGSGSAPPIASAPAAPASTPTRLQSLSSQPAPPIKRTVEATTPVSPPTVTPGPATAEVGNTAFRPDLRQVLKMRQGKLYITTALGEIIVEGSNLKFWLNEETMASNSTNTVDFKSYRDRETNPVANHIAL